MRIIWLILVTVAIFGCGSGDGVNRIDTTGFVTVDGAPVVFGEVQFLPDQSAGNSGPMGFATIKLGAFDTAQTGQPPVEGPNVMRVTAYDEELPETMVDPEAEGAEDIAEEMPAGPQPILVNYQINVEIKGEAVEADLPADAVGFGVSSSRSGRSSSGP